MPGTHKRTGRGRPVNRTTKLGRLIDERNLKAYEVSARSGVYARALTEYTNGRRVITEDHAWALARVLDCHPRDIIEDGLTENLTDTCGRPFDKSLKSAKEVPTPHLKPLPETPTQPKVPHNPTVAPERLIRKAV